MRPRRLAVLFAALLSSALLARAEDLSVSAMRPAWAKERAAIATHPLNPACMATQVTSTSAVAYGALARVLDQNAMGVNDGKGS